MALSLASALSAKQKALADNRKPASAQVIKTFFSYWAQHKGNNDLQFVAITGLDSADKVVADAACKLHVLYLVKPTASTTDAWVKGSDHATVAAANGDIVFKFIGTSGGGQEVCFVSGNGLRFGTGLTFGSHTTVNGSTDSNIADAPVGFAIVGADA